MSPWGNKVSTKVLHSERLTSPYMNSRLTRHNGVARGRISAATSLRNLFRPLELRPNGGFSRSGEAVKHYNTSGICAARRCASDEYTGVDMELFDEAIEEVGHFASCLCRSSAYKVPPCEVNSLPYCERTHVYFASPSVVFAGAPSVTGLIDTTHLALLFSGGYPPVLSFKCLTVSITLVEDHDLGMILAGRSRAEGRI